MPRAQNRFRNPTRRPGDRLRGLPALLLLGCLAAGAVHGAEEDCDRNLKDAADSYRLGRFERVPEELQPCLRRGVSAAQEREAYALLAKTWLAMDELDQATAAVTTLVNLYPDFSPAFGDPPRFVKLVEQIRSGLRPRVLVSSVSRMQESLAEAPATVVVITADEIARRGYLDLAAVLDDLPGFDLTRGNGDLYTSFYQRGYRAANDRTLVLVDGIEGNDLWQGTACLSRQYPLSNVDRIEVVYGPASTMYGPNAFVGVINVVTKKPDAFLGEGEAIGGRVLAGGGSWDTHYVDATVAGRHRRRNVDYSLTARRYRSDEMDRSQYEQWNYAPHDAEYYLNKLRLEGEEKVYEFLGGFEDPRDVVRILDQSDLVDVQREDGTGRITAISLTDQGAAAAARADREALEQLVEGRPVEFSDLTDTSFVDARLRLDNLTFGFQMWEREEGFNSWYVDDLYAGARNGTLWIPVQTLLHLKYERDLGPRLGMTFSSQFKRHVLASGTREQQLINYADGNLNFLDLAKEEEPVPSYWRRTFYRLSSRQLRNDLTLRYRRSSKLSVVGGLEARTSLLQGDYRRTVDCPNLRDGECPKGEKKEDKEGQFFDQLDLGAFAQATYRHTERLRLVLGARLDYNDVREEGGYGTVFNPRVGVVYSRKSYVLKAVYATAFKDASNFNRYASAPGLRNETNPELAPERVKNLDLSARWQVSPEFAVDLAAYRASYSNAVAPQRIKNEDGTTTLKNMAIGTLEIMGLQATFDWQRDGYRIFGNYTYTDPRNTSPMQAEHREKVSELRVGDIAEHRINLGFHARIRERFHLNLRLNWVGERKAGIETTVGYYINPDEGVIEGTFPSYLVANAALTYRDVLADLDLQLLVQNLLDEEYFHPGVNTADGTSYASRQPQAERSFFLRLTHDF